VDFINYLEKMTIILVLPIRGGSVLIVPGYLVIEFAVSWTRFCLFVVCQLDLSYLTLDVHRACREIESGNTFPEQEP
jgi:hypothetical protein